MGDQAEPVHIHGKQIIGHFDRSGIPPMVDIGHPQARDAIVKDIDDLLRPHVGIPPAMAQVALYDPRYITFPRLYTAFIAKSKFADLYKATLRARGDLAPLADLAFISSPTALRVFSRLLITLAANFRWKVKTLDIIHSFRQSTDLNGRDVLVITHRRRSIYPGKVTFRHRPANSKPYIDLDCVFFWRDPATEVGAPPCAGSSRSRPY